MRFSLLLVVLVLGSFQVVSFVVDAVLPVFVAGSGL